MPTLAPSSPEAPAREPGSRYPLLDPLRGVAATAVVLDHIALLKFGYFAVLVFFVISGYCIVASAEAGLRRGMTIAEYMRRRLRRIYPPYLISVVFFLITRAIKWRETGRFDLADRPPIQWIQTLTLTQWVDLLGVHGTYPYNSPSLFVAAHWSLNYEEQFYLFVGLAMVLCARIGARLRTILLPFTVATLGLMAARPTLCIGLFVDYWPLFGVGVAVYYRLVHADERTLRRGLDAALGALFLASLWLTLHRVRVRDERYIWEDLLVASSLAIFLVLVRPFQDRLMTLLPLRLLGKLGTVSYSLYLIHQFNVTLMVRIAGKLIPAERWSVANLGLQLALHIALASGFWWLFERPFLNRPVGAVGARPGAATVPALEP